MAEFESQNTAQTAPAPADPGYAQVSEFWDTNTIPHHHAVESEEDGKRHGRIYYGPRAAQTRAAEQRWQRSLMFPQTMDAGLTTRSNSSALTPEASAASRSVVPSSLARWAMADALS